MQSFIQPPHQYHSSSKTFDLLTEFLSLERNSVWQKSCFSQCEALKEAGMTQGDKMLGRKANNQMFACFLKM